MPIVLFLSLLLADIAVAKPKKQADNIPKELRALLKRGGWTPTPTNSARYQVGDVFDFSNNKMVTQGAKCFDELPDPRPMTDLAITRMLKGGLKIPLGFFKGNVFAKGLVSCKGLFFNKGLVFFTELVFFKGRLFFSKGLFLVGQNKTACKKLAASHGWIRKSLKKHPVLER